MPQRARIARIAVPIFVLSASAGARETRQPAAVRLGPGAIQVDGAVDDPGWAGVAFTAGFLQNRPVDGAAPSQPTDLEAPVGRSAFRPHGSNALHAGTATVMKLSTRGGSTW
jgi:hypothetical protein